MAGHGRGGGGEGSGVRIRRQRLKGFAALRVAVRDFGVRPKSDFNFPNLGFYFPIVDFSC